MNEYPITEEQIRFYEENGYIQLFDVLTPEELEASRAAMEEILNASLGPQVDRSAGRSDYEKIFVQKVNLWRVHEGMRQYVLNPKIAEIARRLSRSSRVRLWHDHALVKLPEDSKPSHWHQDLPYWPMVETGALSCWMALDDVNTENGCMQFVPKSHTWGRFPGINLVNPQDLFGMVPEPETKSFEPVVMAMPAGSCTFHNGLTFHYASPNRTNRPRRAMITIYMPEGIHYKEQGHVVTDGLGLKDGQLLEGEMFPVLAEKA